MCGRFAVGDPDPAVWAEWLGLNAPAELAPPSWNVAPTSRVAVVRAENGARRLDRARWGLIPHWWKKPLAEMKASTFNARSEEAFQKPMFRDAWKHGRCLIPALGYFEWSGKKGAKTPWFVSLRRNTPGLCFAGLWAEPRIEGTPLLTATILTCAAGKATKHLHPRTPVILAEEDWRAWLAPGPAPEGLMRAPPDDRVTATEVGLAVGNTRNDGPEMIEPVGLGL